MINEFAEALVVPLIVRAQQTGFDTSMFMECFRCTAGLKQPVSKFLYNNLVVNGPGTTLADRPQSWQTIDFIKSEFKITVSVPRLVLNLHHGISLTEDNGSRSNPHNVSQTLQLIELLVEKEIFKPQEIAIVTPYRA